MFPNIVEKTTLLRSIFLEFFALAFAAEVLFHSPKLEIASRANQFHYIIL